ncbi:MAG: iron-containing alcohol dehydrogenase [Deltaproteobacteria bacterium]|nr:iron-containing alcohol dehydrogenase [Deltaproteobacteria bacterium]
MGAIKTGEEREIFYSPTKIIFGLGAIKDLPNECKQLGKKPLIVTDSFMSKTEIVKDIMEILKSAGMEPGLYDGVVPEPPLESVDNGVKVALEGNYDVIVGVGGGSSMDTAKGVAIVTGNGGKVLDYVGMDQVPKPGLPKILIPTTAGTGSEVTRVFVVTDLNDNTKKVVYSAYNLSNVALIDPALTLGMPPSVTADTGMDALVHAIETYVAITATQFSDPFAEKAIRLISKYLPIATIKGENIEARYYMALAATLAGLAFASGGLGAVHALAYPLGTEYHMSHGRSNAIMLPYVMEYNLPGNFEKYAKIAEFMGEKVDNLSDSDAAIKSVEAVKRLQKNVGIPSRLRDYNIKKEDLSKLVEGGMKQARLFVPNPRNLSKEDVEKIYEMAY